MRILACLAASLAVVLALLQLGRMPWPEETRGRPGAAPPQEVIALEEIVPTSQARRAPPPPAPLPPVVVPDETLLESPRLDIDLTSVVPQAAPVPAPPREGPAAPAPAGQGEAVAETGPHPVRFVEPEYTREARRRRVRAEVVVEVEIDARGQVQAARVVNRYLLHGDDRPKEPVPALGYGLEEAAVAAAERWMFRPARRDGKAVPSYTTLAFKFGV